jgi:hypothetical protein
VRQCRIFCEKEKRGNESKRGEGNQGGKQGKRGKGRKGCKRDNIGKKSNLSMNGEEGREAMETRVTSEA